ncbi:MAG TPA: histidinol-phosphate transaminase [archaeon]|nr:histidinol-phosphate transaminase [archaeon]
MNLSRSVKNIVRPDLLELKAYRSPCFEYQIKLDLNESPFDLPEEIKEAIFERTRGLLWQRYHDEFETPLKKALADHVGHDSRGVLIGNGSNELIFHTLLSTVKNSGAVVSLEPSFSLYRQNVKVLGGKPVPFWLSGESFTVDPREVIRLARDSKADAVVLCSPNNPTGGRIPNEVIEKIAHSVEAAVVVDEAYAHFAGDNALGLLRKCPNLIVIRTFSKAFGLAGLRFGFALCAPELAEQICKVQLPHHVNFFTQLAALTLLERPELVEQRVAEIKQGRKHLQTELSKITGLKVFPSETNFVMIECNAKSPAEIFEGLLSRGILVRDISKYQGLGRCLRITVGPPRDNDAFLEALREVTA